MNSASPASASAGSSARPSTPSNSRAEGHRPQQPARDSVRLPGSALAFLSPTTLGGPGLGLASRAAKLVLSTERRGPPPNAPELEGCCGIARACPTVFRRRASFFSRIGIDGEAVGTAVGGGEITARARGQIAVLLPEYGRSGGSWRYRRTVMNGILRRPRNGSSWRDLPERYGAWQTCCDRCPCDGRDRPPSVLVNAGQRNEASGSRRCSTASGRHAPPESRDARASALRACSPTASTPTACGTPSRRRSTPYAITERRDQRGRANKRAERPPSDAAAHARRIVVERFANRPKQRRGVAPPHERGRPTTRRWWSSRCRWSA